MIATTTSKKLLTDTLRSVSRAFYLTLRVLPKDLRAPIGLAYLLARVADTISDTTLLPPAKRLFHLRALRARLEGMADTSAVLDITRSLTEEHSISDEYLLLASLPEAFAMLDSLPEIDSTLVRSVVITLTHGMEIDLTTFPPEDSGQIEALESLEDLDRYIYYVAGCVGEFWTDITMAHTASLEQWDRRYMAELGVSFGKALQMTNVLRDVPRDLEEGRCYLPEIELTRLGVSPQDLLEPDSITRVRPLLVTLLKRALRHYRAAEEYLLAIPRRNLRLRLAVLWPILIGLATLAKLARNDAWLDPGRPSRVTRGWVYRMMGLSVPCAPSNTVLKAWTGRLRRQVEAAM